MDSPEENGFQPRTRKQGFEDSQLEKPVLPSRYKETTDPVLGRTLPSLLLEAVHNNPNPRAFNRLQGNRWISISTQEFQELAEQVAFGLQDLNLARADRICLFMDSDPYFGIVDMGCLLAGLVDVPIYLTHTQDGIEYVLKHAEARALVVSTAGYLEKLGPVLPQLKNLESVVVMEPQGQEDRCRECVSGLDIRLATFSELLDIGRAHLEKEPGAANHLRDQISVKDLATIVYTSGTTGRPKGVMLTHENVSFNALTAFGGLETLRRGEETTLSFLPLTHAFARTLHYGFLNYGASVYFLHPDQISNQLKRVRPTIFATVPRVLEKFYDRILERGERLGGLSRRLFRWALHQAQRHDPERTLSGWDRVKLKAADRLVFSKWRKALGNRVQCIISGGAPLREDLVTLFGAAGITILQGYGLTETSPIICFTRPTFNQAGTVGFPLAGVEVGLAPDGEILTRGPHVMRGYYRSPLSTRDTIDTHEWLHTGDIGEFTSRGLLKITDRKKDLFKLSTGKYVMPQPLEAALLSDPLVDQVLVVGEGRKFCAALIFPSLDNLKALAGRLGLSSDLSLKQIVESSRVEAHFQRLIETSNASLPHWSNIHHFRLIPSPLTVENGFLTPTLKVRRSLVKAEFADEIDSMYEESEGASQEADHA